MFENEQMASSVLRSANKLNTSVNDDVKTIKIFRDMTKSDHERRKALVEEMKEKNLELTNNGVQDMK